MLNLQNVDDAKQKLNRYDPSTFTGVNDSFRFFTNKLEIVTFRHIHDLAIDFVHPVTVLTGINKSGKTSILLLIACSHYDFQRYDSTNPVSSLRRHTWSDVLPFTRYESERSNYKYKLKWRIGNDTRTGEGKRIARSEAWTGLAKSSSDTRRRNAQIRGREVRLIDLERLLPARYFSSRLFSKIAAQKRRHRLSEDIEKAFAYLFELPTIVQLFEIGSHINKKAYLIKYRKSYSSYNIASGEEALINILRDIIDTPNDSLILIDELEAGLHPNVQRRMADIIQYISWTHKKQFILTTHSPILLSAFNQKSRKYIEINRDRSFKVVDNIPTNYAYSKMDSVAHPIIQLYCEDELAEYIVKNVILETNKVKPYYERLVNIVKSGPHNLVRDDYISHKRTFSQTRHKIGYCCVFDGDRYEDPTYASLVSDPNEFVFILKPYEQPEKTLIKAFLAVHPDEQLKSALDITDHHELFNKMVEIGLATSSIQAREYCWQEYVKTISYSELKTNLTVFINRTINHFASLCD